MRARRSLHRDNLLVIRRLFAFTSLLSALACFALLLASVRSFWIVDEFRRVGDFVHSGAVVRTSVIVRFDYGSTHIAYGLMSWPATPDARGGRPIYQWEIDMPQSTVPRSNYTTPQVSPRMIWKRPGFLFAQRPPIRGAGGCYQRQVYLRFPTPLAIVPTAISPMIFVVLRRRRLQRIKDRLCAGCNYNLTGNTSGICPECGKPVEYAVEQLQISQ